MMNFKRCPRMFFKNFRMWNPVCRRRKWLAGPLCGPFPSSGSAWNIVRQFRQQAAGPSSLHWGYHTIRILPPLIGSRVGGGQKTDSLGPDCKCHLKCNFCMLKLSWMCCSEIWKVLGVQLCVVVRWAGNSQNPSDLAAWNLPGDSQAFQTSFTWDFATFRAYQAQFEDSMVFKYFQRGKKVKLGEWFVHNACWKIAIRMPLINMHNTVRENLAFRDFLLQIISKHWVIGNFRRIYRKLARKQREFGWSMDEKFVNLPRNKPITDIRPIIVNSLKFVDGPLSFDTNFCGRSMELTRSLQEIPWMIRQSMINRLVLFCNFFVYEKTQENNTKA